jgi:hypothetical protein
MAFAGNSGGAAVILAVATLNHPLAGTSGVAYNADGISLEVRGNTATRIAGGPVANGPSAHLNSLSVAITATALAAFQNVNDIDGSTTDSAVLTTAAAAGNTQGLPANFGPGRGNWVAADIPRVQLTVYPDSAAYSPAASSSPSSPTNDLAHNYLWVPAPTFAGGNLSWSFKNMSMAAITDLTLVFQYQHSVSM